jgi:hypothetical protein
MGILRHNFATLGAITARADALRAMIRAFPRDDIGNWIWPSDEDEEPSIVAWHDELSALTGNAFRGYRTRRQFEAGVAAAMATLGDTGPGPAATVAIVAKSKEPANHNVIHAEATFAKASVAASVAPKSDAYDETASLEDIRNETRQHHRRSVSEYARRWGMSVPEASKRITRLERKNLIRTAREGQFKIVTWAKPAATRRAAA